MSLGRGHGTKNFIKGYSLFTRWPIKDAKNERLQGLLLGSGWDHAASSGYNSAKNSVCDYVRNNLKSPLVLVSNSMAICGPPSLTDDRNYPNLGGIPTKGKIYFTRYF